MRKLRGECNSLIWDWGWHIPNNGISNIVIDSFAYVNNYVIN